MQRTTAIVAAALALMLAACATSDNVPPDKELARAELALEHATRANAAEHAPIELQEATEKLQAAQAAQADHHYREARRLAEQAEASAELASAKAETARTQARVEDARKNIETLRDEVQTSGLEETQ